MVHKYSGGTEFRTGRLRFVIVKQGWLQTDDGLKPAYEAVRLCDGQTRLDCKRMFLASYVENLPSLSTGRERETLPKAA